MSKHYTSRLGVRYRLDTERLILEGVSTEVEVCRLTSGQYLGDIVGVIHYVMETQKYRVYRLRNSITLTHYSKVTKFRQALNLLESAIHEYVGV